MSEIKHVSYEEALEMGPEKFVEDYLFPAMRRFEGNGFAMQTWAAKRTPGTTMFVDLVEHTVPVCGTAACIGGTMSIILFPKDVYKFSATKLGKVLGISGEQAGGLFYRWGGYGSTDLRKGYQQWPKDFVVKFKEAKTPSEKEQVAEQLIRLVLKTKGICLEPSRMRRAVATTKRIMGLK